MRLSTAFTALLIALQSKPALSQEPSAVNSVTVNGVKYINKGLVAFGYVPSNMKESTGDTIGGIGSAIALKQGTWAAIGNGSFTGTLICHPDKGYTPNGPVDYQSRHHEFDFVLTPYYGSKNLNFTAAQKTLSLQYKSTVLEYDVGNKTTSALDPQGIREPSPSTNISFPQALPIVSNSDNRLVLDPEGIILNDDGSIWISDEYTPGIFKISASAEVEQALPIPAAILPMDKNGNLMFTGQDDPKTGRASNAGVPPWIFPFGAEATTKITGFENLTIDPSTGTLYAMLQSATIQDGGSDQTTARYTRLLAYNVQGALPLLVGEYVVPLPLSQKKGKTEGSSEILYIGDGVLFVLARDGDGHGGNDDSSSYKQIDIISLQGATDIHGTKFDSPQHPVAPGGKLDSSVKPVQYFSFIDMVDDDQLARMGLHNGSPDNATLINAKWESLTVAPVNDPAFPDDYFVFTGSDNDYLSTQGISLGVPYDAGIDVQNEFMVFRVTIPGAPFTF